MTDPRCRSGKHCVRLTAEGAGLTSQPGALCHGCVEDIQKRLNELPHLATALETMKGSWGSISYEARVGGSKDAPTPLHVGIVDLVDEIRDVVDRTGGYAVRDLVTHSAEKWIIWRNGRRQETELDGVQRALDVRRVHSKASSRVGFDKVWQRRAAACPNCQLPTLGSWSGEDLILCSSEDCRASFTKTDYENYCFSTSLSEKGKKCQSR